MCLADITTHTQVVIFIHFAPGADDNASGTAAALEIARVIISNGYQPEATIKFITFGAEEYGLVGQCGLCRLCS